MKLEKKMIYMSAKKKVFGKVLSTLNINRYNGRLNIWTKNEIAFNLIYAKS